jgi:hypothetical protein
MNVASKKVAEGRNIQASFLFFLSIFFLTSLFSKTFGQQTVITTTSFCVNDGTATIAGVPGVSPFNVVVITHPPLYNPVDAGGNRLSLIPDSTDTFGSLYPGNYVFEYTDANGAKTNVSATITGTYVIPGNADYSPIGVAPTNCIAGNTGVISGVLTNGLAPYVYKIVAGPNNVGKIDSTGTLSGLSGGTIYKVEAIDACNNQQTRDVSIPTMNISISNPSVSATSCTTFSLDAINTFPSPKPAGSKFVITNSSGVELGSGTSIPVSFTSTKSAVLAGLFVKLVDSCGGSSAPVPFSTLTNDWTFTAAATALNCATDNYSINSLTTTGFITPTATYTIRFSDGTSEVWDGTVPYTTTHPISAAGDNLTIEIKDGCNAVKTIVKDYSFSVDGTNVGVFENCNLSGIVNASSGLNGIAGINYSLPVNFSISPNPNGTVANTTGDFPNLPDGTYEISATDNCGRTFTYSKTFTHSWITYGNVVNECNIGFFLQYVTVPYNAKSPVTITQYDGSQPITSSSVVLSTKIENSTGNGNPNSLSPAAYITFTNRTVNQVTTYVVTDACGVSDTITLTNPAISSGPISHSSSVINKCVNRGDIYVTGVNDVNGNNQNPLNVRVWNINNPTNVLYNALPGYYRFTNTLILTDQPVGKYVVEYSLLYCNSSKTVYDTVEVAPYTQPSIKIGLYFKCDPLSPTTQLLVSGVGGIKPYTYQVIGSSPSGFTTTSQGSQAFTVPSTFNSIIVKIVDACGNGTTKAVPIKPALKPVIKLKGVVDPCLLPFSISMHVDSSIYSAFSATTYAWKKLTGTGASSTTIISTNASIPVTLPADAGKYSITIS